MDTGKCALCMQPPKDTVVVTTRRWRVVHANDELYYPGFLRVVWGIHVAEMTDLSPEARQEFMTVVWHVEKAVRDVMRPDKINLACFGNWVPHLHWHVIPRFRDDIHFPDTIWSLPRQEPDSLALEKRGFLLPKLAEAVQQSLLPLTG